MSSVSSVRLRRVSFDFDVVPDAVAEVVAGLSESWSAVVVAAVLLGASLLPDVVVAIGRSPSTRVAPSTSPEVLVLDPSDTVTPFLRPQSMPKRPGNSAGRCRPGRGASGRRVDVPDTGSAEPSDATSNDEVRVTL